MGVWVERTSTVRKKVVSTYEIEIVLNSNHFSLNKFFVFTYFVQKMSFFPATEFRIWLFAIHWSNSMQIHRAGCAAHLHI
jgi:hypothetical protein